MRAQCITKLCNFVYPSNSSKIGIQLSNLTPHSLLKVYTRRSIPTHRKIKITIFTTFSNFERNFQVKLSKQCVPSELLVASKLASTRACMVYKLNNNAGEQIFWEWEHKVSQNYVNLCTLQIPPKSVYRALTSHLSCCINLTDGVLII